MQLMQHCLSNPTYQDGDFNEDGIIDTLDHDYLESIIENAFEEFDLELDFA